MAMLDFFDKLPRPICAAVLTACSASELARLECCASIFHDGDAIFGDSSLCVTEYAALMAVRERLALEKAELPVLLPGETWKIVWSLASSVLAQCGSSAHARRGALQALTCQEELCDVGAEHLRGLSAAASSLLRRGCPGTMWATRVVHLAQELGISGRWTAGVQLLHCVASAFDGDGAGAGRSLVRSELLAAASTFLIDKCYASTYVSSDEEENRDVALAHEFAREAVSLARAAGDDACEALLSEPGGRLRGAPRPLPRGAALRRRRLLEALYAEGRASAICGQHKALGAMVGDAAREARLPLPEVLFARGQAALQEAVELAEEDPVEKARMSAALAELWYCAASANARGAGALVPDAEGHDEFERLACLPPLPDLPPDIINPHVICHIYAGRLTYASLDRTAEAVRTLEGAGEGESLLAARMLKDLGKAHGFAAMLNPRLYNMAGLEHRDHGESEVLLNRALEVQRKLQGEKHRNTTNVRRLLGRNGHSDLHHGSESQDSEEDADAEEREAGHYLAEIEEEAVRDRGAAGAEPGA